MFLQNVFLSGHSCYVTRSLGVEVAYEIMTTNTFGVETCIYIKLCEITSDIEYVIENIFEID